MGQFDDPDADAWLRGMCCSLPLFGVGFSIWGADGGWSLFRCVIRAEMRQCSGELRKMNRCISLDWFVISIIFRVLAVRFGCTVLFFSFNICCILISQKKKCDVGFNTSRRQQQVVPTRHYYVLDQSII